MPGSEFVISDMPLSVGFVRKRVEKFLSDSGLRLDSVDTYMAVTRGEDDEILAGGGLEGDVIKCIAVSPAARSEGLTNSLISSLISRAHENGHDSVKVYTKPENRRIFESLGFEVLACAPKAILMENGRGIRRYLRYLEGLRREGKNGVIVMNANPFTLGHRYLVEQAAAKCDNLYVIAVKEDRSRFSYAERLAMIKAGCTGIPNVTVCEGSDYAISQATFPTYFLKRLDDATDTHIALDLDLFAGTVAPALGAVVRFVGSEKSDLLTKRYNDLMAATLPGRGIAFAEVPRFSLNGVPVSASDVRAFMDGGVLSSAMALCPRSTVPYLLADEAVRAMQAELDATPKPGLVDRNGSGAHTDMDYGTMTRSIQALRPYLAELALLGWQDGLPSAGEVRRIGIDAEKAMREATGGVNTHKGALFCLGLAVAAAANTCRFSGRIEENGLRFRVCAIAWGIPSTKDTHGAEVVEKHKVAGALENARKGWPLLFSDWLPFYRSLGEDSMRLPKTLLRIMSSLDDTNILYRKGGDAAAEVKGRSASLLEDFSPEGLEKLDSEFTNGNISPGGSADMLSLTIFINTILN